MLRRDPLLHFLLIGGLLFAVLSWLAPEPAPDRILIPADRVAELSRTVELLQGRPPTEEQLERLVADAIREEVYYREAIARGLDIDDTVVRQRLIEKLRELTENVVDPLPPETDLEAWFDDNRERFRIPELVSFDHVFFSPEQRGDAVVAEAEAALAALRDGATVDGMGDRTPLSGRFEVADAARVGVLFGDALTEAVFSANLDEWIGPFESDFGWHVVRVDERTPARDPAFSEVEERVRNVYSAEQLAAANAAAYEAMRSGFEIAVEWEPGSEPEAWP